MSYGIEIRNASNNVVIDGSYANLMVREKGLANITQTTVSSYPAFSWQEYDIQNVEYPNGLIFARPGSTFVGRVRVDSDTVEAPITFNLDGFKTYARSRTFRVPIMMAQYQAVFPTRNSGFGLDIYNSSGETVFRDDLKPLVIVDVIQAPVGLYSNGSTITREHNYCPNAWYSINTMHNEVWDTSGIGRLGMFELIRQSSNTSLQWQMFTTFLGRNFNKNKYQSPGYIIVAKEGN